MAGLVKTVASTCGRFQIEIELRSESVFKLTALKWHEEWVDGYKMGEAWITVRNTHLVFTDTLENAEELAAEMLRTLLG